MFTLKQKWPQLACAPAALLVAGTAGQAETTIEVYGYGKLDLIYDVDTDLGLTIFGLGSLEPGTDSESTSQAHAFQSRLGFRSNTDTAWGPLKTQVEGDFFGDGGGGFRLRHAYGEVGGILAGQTWSNFMPIESYPTTVDFQGPAGIPFARTAQLRYSHEFGGLNLSASVEDDDAGAHGAVTAAASYGFDNGFVKLAGISRQLDGPSGNVDAYGVNISGNATPWQGGTIQASYTTGEGIGSLMVFGGDDLDGDTAIETEAYTVAIAQALNDQFTIGAAYGFRDIDSGAATDTESLETVHLTAFYSPLENVTFGVEYITGERTLFNDSTASADRIQSSVQFNF
jgi:hypothetical protein